MNKNTLIYLFVLACFLIGLSGFKTTKTVKPNVDSIKIDSATNLKIDTGYELVTAHCTGCHSSKLVIQYGASRQDWLNKIRWMQQKQKLWQLGEAEPIILDYLAKNYPAKERIDRRANLKNINWYKLNK
jgi:mono/diheme cytochrome c family protein